MATGKHTRSVFKAISWRITGPVDTMLVLWVITREFKFALSMSIGFVEPFTKIILDYGHERLWNRISFGRVKARDGYAI